MLKNLYIATSSPRSGKSLISLGIMELLSHRIEKLGFFRPLVRHTEPPDNDIELIRQRYQLHTPYEACYGLSHAEATSLIMEGKSQELFTRVFDRYKALERDCDFVVCEGTDMTSLAAPLEFDFNAQIANQIDASVVVVVDGRQSTPQEVAGLAHQATESFEEEGCRLLAVMVNRVTADLADDVRVMLDEQWTDPFPVYVVPEKQTLSKPTVRRIAQALGADSLHGAFGNVNRIVRNYKVAAMELTNFLKHIEEDSLIITPGDRADLVIGSLAAFQSINYPKIAGIILTGGMVLSAEVSWLIDGMGACAVPIYHVETDTFETASRISEVIDTIAPDNAPKIATALGHFEKHVDLEELSHRIELTRSTRVTPIMFQYDLVEQAKSDKQHIVLPEGKDDRILCATDMLLRRNVVDITLLGAPSLIRQNAAALGLDIEKASIINPAESPDLQDYQETYYELRRHRGMTLEQAGETLLDVSYFGTMMVYKGCAHAMVSGAAHTTRHTIRPALEFIKACPGRKIVSSVFFMCLEDRVLVYGDCAVNPNPSAEELADIALASADTAKAFGIEPLVAMLSYSSGSSGTGGDVDKVRRATELVREQRSGLLIEGPIQYDAAIDMGVGLQKLPGSDVAGRATVFVFPDLNTGNNTYKAVQRSSKAIAMGPVLQGLRKPVNDLSRGCTVVDIVNTVAITAIQAKGAGKC